MVLLLRYQILCAGLLIICHLIQISFEARVGDGHLSLYTGKAINLTDTRGSCLADGIRYPSETSIPRDHPCHYCICYQALVTCYWKQCSAPPEDCEVMEFENTCNPSLFVCEIPIEVRPQPRLEFGARLKPRRKRKLWRKRPTRAADSKLKLPIEDDSFSLLFEDALQRYPQKLRTRRAIIGSASERTTNRLFREDTSCTILGVKYELGDIIGVASDVCMSCHCAAGKMFCSPKCCFLPTSFSLTDVSQGNSVFIRSRSRGAGRSPSPFHYINNQYGRGSLL